jgi:hypothetical protein
METCLHNDKVKGTTVAPTCTEAGYTNYYCNDCNKDVQLDIVAALDHDWNTVSPTQTVEATCTTDGYKVYACTRCDATSKEVIAALGHNWDMDNPTQVVAPTCTAAGYTIYSCTRCDETTQLNPTDALGHKWDWTNAVETDGGDSLTAPCKHGGCTETKVKQLIKDTWDKESAEIWTSGQGTAEDPYLIESAANLAYLAKAVRGEVPASAVTASTSSITTMATGEKFSNTYFKLTVDLVLPSWTPIGSSSCPFGGNFDGNGHTINLKLEGSSTYSGLFAKIMGTASSPAVISNLTMRGTVEVKNSFVGAIAGCANYAEFNNVINEASVKGTYYVGGLVGSLNAAATFNYCANKGDIACTAGASSNSYAGGIVGFAGSYVTTMKYCYATGGVTGASYVGGLCGYGTSTSNVFDHCFVGKDIKVSSSKSGSAGYLFGSVKTKAGYTCYYNAVENANTSSLYYAAKANCVTSGNNATQTAYNDYADLMSTSKLGNAKVGEGDAAVNVFKTDTTVNADSAPALYSETAPKVRVSINYTATDGGTVSRSLENLYTTDTAKGSTATAAPGYHFVKWVVGADADAASEAVSTEANYIPQADSETGAMVGATYKAIFEQDPYTIVYKSNVEGSDQADVTVERTIGAASEGEGFNLADASTFQNGYLELVGWSTDAIATDDSTIYAPGQLIEQDLTTEGGAQIVLYAQWKDTRQAATIVLDKEDSDLVLVHKEASDGTTAGVQEYDISLTASGVDRDVNALVITSSNPSVATAAIVDGKLRVTTTGGGKATITVSANSLDELGGYLASESSVSFEVAVVGITFRGGSLRVDDGDDYTKASMRMGYDITFPEGFDASTCSWSWGYGLSEDRIVFERDGANFVKHEDGSITSNIVFTNVKSAYFEKSLYAQLKVTCMVNGKEYSFTDDVRERSVAQVATLVADSPQETDEARAYATKLLEQLPSYDEKNWTSYY